MTKYSIPFCSFSWELYLKISSLVEFDTSLKSMWDFDFNLPQFRPYFVEHNTNYYLFLHAHYINKALKELGYEPLDDNWKRYNCVVRMSQEEPFIRQFSPSYVKSLVKKQLHLHHFTDKMIDDRLDKFTVENGRKQLHSSWAIPRNVIVRFDNCVYYDINKAHMDALIEIFPELKEWFINVAKKSKTDKRYKNIANFYVGCLGSKSSKHRKTYEWIVDRTTKKIEKLLDAIDNPNGRLVYVNTDGFVYQNPKITLETSSIIGDIKLETEETTFYMFNYHDDNKYKTPYKMIQYGDEKKCISNIQIKDFEFIDLRKGDVISYKEVIDRENHTKKHTEIEQHKARTIIYE